MYVFCTVILLVISNIGTDYDHFKIRETIGRFAFVGYFVFAVYRYNYKLIDSGLRIWNFIIKKKTWFFQFIIIL